MFSPWEAKPVLSGVGDRVAGAGDGAGHAEIASIPRNLAVLLPDHVPFHSWMFSPLFGAIALQGIRQAEAVVGHQPVAIIGLGLIGQLVGADSQGRWLPSCSVSTSTRIGLRSPLDLGADAPLPPNETAHRDGCVRYRGDEASMPCSSPAGPPARATNLCNWGSELRQEAAGDCGGCGGAVGMDIPRRPFYEKELDFRLSRSYGPGRDDPEYEEKGQDYPYPYVRWTEQRNMEAFIQLLAQGRFNLEALVTHRFAIDEAPRAYDVISWKIPAALHGRRPDLSRAAG